MDVRIGVTQTARDIAVEIADDVDRDELKAKIDAALTGAVDRKSTRLNSSHSQQSRMPSSA